MFKRFHLLIVSMFAAHVMTTANIVFAESTVSRRDLRDFLQETTWPKDLQNPDGQRVLYAFHDDFRIIITGEEGLAKVVYMQIADTLRYLKNRDALGITGQCKRSSSEVDFEN